MFSLQFWERENPEALASGRVELRGKILDSLNRIKWIGDGRFMQYMISLNPSQSRMHLCSSYA